jgi:hypothetical protein
MPVDEKKHWLTHGTSAFGSPPGIPLTFIDRMQACPDLHGELQPPLRWPIKGFLCLIEGQLHMLLLLWPRSGCTAREFIILPPDLAVVVQMERDVDEFLMSKCAQRKEVDKELQVSLAIVSI